MKPVYLMMATVMLAGCGGDEFQDLRDFVQNSGADMRGKIDPPPEVKPYESFVYANDTELPDPFKPLTSELSSLGGGARAGGVDEGRPREALEEFPLENLKMVGYLYRNNIGYAVIRAPDGKLHRVRAGHHVGMNFGEIKEVNETEILIREMVPDGAGVWTERMSSMILAE